MKYVVVQGKWASTKVEGYLYASSVVTGFKRLFGYISGDNEPKVKVNMTGLPFVMQQTSASLWPPCSAC